MTRVFPAVILLLAGCASAPTGPGVMVLPGSGKSFDQFRFDDHECRQYASSQVGGALAGTDAAHASGRTLQQRYDIGYQQCMYAKGHKIPMARGYDRPYRSRQAAPPPPPPPGTPPPPPPQS